MSNNEKIKEIVINETAELIDDIYNDGAKQIVQESGKTLALIPQTINAILLPLRKWIAEREASLEEVKILLEKKLRNIDVKEIVEPEKYVAVPALQAISYSMNSEVLKNMYANLLVNSMKKDTKENVHPSFVEMIKQMSPNDAKIFTKIHDDNPKPIMYLWAKNKNEEGYFAQVNNLTWINIYDYEVVSVCIDNLKRMGLIEIAEGEYTHDPNYNNIRETSEYKRFKKEYDDSDIVVIEKKHFIKITALGNSFYKICVKD